MDSVCQFKNYLYIIFFCLFLGGCQPKVYLMPPPLGFNPDDELFKFSIENQDENFLTTLYATNRVPFQEMKNDTQYSIFPSDELRMGFVVHSLGTERMTWEETLALSLERDRDEDLLVKQEYNREMVLYHLNDDLMQTTAEADGFFDQINKLLAQSIDKDILLYVHGANSNFYRATAQGAQFYHFTGHNTVILTFSWPSAESLLKYKTDVAHAKKTIPAFARMVELLATYTDAKNINLIAYSAGAQIVAPGLAYFVDENPDLSNEGLKKKFRIGEVYFAAPDTALEPFVERYLKFKDIVKRTTVNVNTADSVLKFSAFQNGESRLGKPDETDLSAEETQILIDASTTSELNFIDIHTSKGLQAEGAHDTWYAHPWVSSDLLMLLLFNASPAERGLKEYWYPDGTKTYLFPDNYEQVLNDLLKKNENTLVKNFSQKRHRRKSV